MVTYPGDPAVSAELVSSIAAGDDYNVTRLALGAHTGTHVDAPVHVLEGGHGADGLPIDALIGRVQVIVWDGAGDVAPEALAALAPGVERVLFRTRNSGHWARDRFVEDHVAVSAAAAERLVGARIRLVGIDYLSIGSREVHRVLLSARVVVVEGLDLRGVAAGTYELVCLPLKLVGADGAPSRVVLVET